MNMIALINTVACLFLLLAAGYAARKLGIINDIFSKGLSTLIIKIGQPALIINSLIRTTYDRFPTNLLAMLSGVRAPEYFSA